MSHVKVPAAAGVLGVGCALPHFHPVFPRTVYHKTQPSLPILINTSQTGRCQILPTVTLTIQHPAEEGGMMSLWGMLGANQSLRKLCQPLLSLSIQCYRSAVNWDWRRGHFLCVWEKKRKKERRARRESIVVMLMVLSGDSGIKMSWNLIAKTSALGLHSHCSETHGRTFYWPPESTQENFDEYSGVNLCRNASVCELELI